MKGAARKFAKRDLFHVKYGDLEPADMPKLPVLRKAREEAIDEHLDLRNSSSGPAHYLLASRYDPEFKRTVRDISFYKFYLFFWSPQQLNLFKEALKNRNLSIGVDARAGIVKVLKIPYGKTGPIFGYVELLDILCKS